MNVVLLRGVLSRSAETRELPSGDVLVTYEVTVPADEDRPAESVRVVWFSAPPSAHGFEAGAEVVVVGRVRRRFFRATGQTRSRTEVVAERVGLARHRAASRAALDALAGAKRALA